MRVAVRRWSVVVILLFALCSALPAAARTTHHTSSPTLSVDSRLEDRRYVVAGDRAYVVGTEDGLFPAMGFHTRGEMGGIWSPPIKLLDGIWFGIDGRWLGPAREFTSGYGYVKMRFPGRDGLGITRTDFVPDGHRTALFGLRLKNTGSARRVSIEVDAHSELMSAYPWGETRPSQKTFNLRDSASYRDGRLVFREKGRPPAKNAAPHDWAAVVGSTLKPTGHATGHNFRGPQDPPVVCPASPASAPARCDDTAYGRGAGGELRYEVKLSANSTRTVWFAVTGSQSGPKEALRVQRRVLADPQGELREKVSRRLALASRTRVSIPGDRTLQKSVGWSKQNLADLTQEARNLEVRRTHTGQEYPPPAGRVKKIRFVGAGFPDYPWLFATDGEYTAFPLVAAGQFSTAEDHLRALEAVSEIANRGSGKVVHETVTDGSVYFGLNSDDGDIDETAKFPSAVALVWRWTGGNRFRDEMYPFVRKNLRYIFRRQDRDGDLWPEGAGNVEASGLGQEKLDVAVYTLRGLYDLADMARSKGDEKTVRWALAKASSMRSRFEKAWWMANIPQYADSLRDPGNKKLEQRWWIGVTPMEAELYPGGRPLYGLATPSHARKALGLRQEHCYTGRFGLYVQGYSGCDPAPPPATPNRQTFTLNTAIMAVGEGNYGRLGEQRRYTDDNAALQLIPDEQPGAMPEIAPSPDYGRSIDEPFNERAQVMQAWGTYGTIWPVVHQQLGVIPDMGRERLAVIPQLPPGQHRISGKNIKLGRGSISVAATAGGGTYRTVVRPRVHLKHLTLGYVVPRGRRVFLVTLDGRPIYYRVYQTHRGREILVRARTSGRQALAVHTLPRRFDSPSGHG
ncbi:glycogen debranching protein [Rubrobacter calidifluminis]|uniref:glycogen debranching protein n=1 Tax=Rubrobacter calidifluminis TaxID=1392640 RepID=UPI002362BFDB|nr:glycogen debranching protein [Rubrobacter calidifluminis]